VLDFVDAETEKTVSFSKHGCRDPDNVAMNSEERSNAVLHCTVIDAIAMKQTNLLGQGYGPLRYGRMKSPNAVAVKSRVIGGKARRKEQQPGGA
jgi:hypothetical protein